MSGMKRRLLLSTFATCAVLSPALSFAHTYPNQPVRLIVPFPAGGATDVLARALSIKLGEKLGQSVVVENRPDAGGTIGSAAVAQAAPDLPTVADALPHFESVTWFGLYGPKAMPADVVQKLNLSLNAALADNDVKARFSRLGAEPISTTPAAFASLAQNERAKRRHIIEQRKIVVE
jgi:tripartite-type tricarboxylate transporter receptor subunit TctC